jgi:hypothetical protein
MKQWQMKYIYLTKLGTLCRQPYGTEVMSKVFEFLTDV